jgi:hypothetical protein
MSYHRVGLSWMKAWAIAGFCSIGFICSVQGQGANNDFFTVPAQSALSVPAPGVLTNDTGGGNLTATLVAGPVNGTLTLNGDGSFTYTPTNNFAGVDGFIYQAGDGFATSNPASVDIMVLGPGELFHDDFSRPTNDGSIFPWTQVSGFMVPGAWNINNGLMQGNGPSYGYGYIHDGDTNWADYSVQAQVQFSSVYAASAGLLGRLDPATGTHYAVWIYPELSNELNIAPGNGTAVLQLIKYQNWTNFTLIGHTVTLPGVGTNWHTLGLTFQGSNILSYFDGNLVTNVTDDGSIDGQPAYTRGSIGLNLWESSVVYTFSVSNVIVSTVTATANPDAYNTFTDTPLFVVAPGILANDAGNGPLTVMLVGGPANGSLALTNNGGFSYTPTNGFVGTDSFTYQCTDGQTTSSVATVTVVVNHATSAGDDAYSVAASTTLSVGQPGILANDTGNGPLTAFLVSGAAHGSLTLTNNGGFSYTPTNDFAGTDSFTYQCTDGQTTSSVATVTITVVPVLTANNDFYSADPGTVLNVPAPGILLNNVSANGVLSAILAGSPAYGTLTWGGDGSFTYQPATNFTGMDGFTYQVTDGQGTSSVGTVDIMVTPPGGLFYDNFARPAGSGSIFPWIQQSGAWSVTNNLLIGTSDFNNYGYAWYGNAGWTNYSVQAQIQFSDPNAWGGGIGGRLDPANGAHYAVWIYPEGSFWAPMHGLPAGLATLQLIKFQNWNTYTLLGSAVPLPDVGTNWHTIKLAFRGANILACFDGSEITNLVDDGTSDGQAAYASGGISLDLWTDGPTAYTFSISKVLVNPLLLNKQYQAQENTPLVVTDPGVLSNDTDVYGTNLTAALVSGPADGTVTLNTNGAFIYTPAANFTGTDGFTVQAADGQNPLGTATVTVTVLPVLTPPAPVITSINLTNDTVIITWSSAAGTTYRLQSNDDLNSTNWNDVPPDVTATGPATLQPDGLGGASQRFYRVLLLTP